MRQHSATSFTGTWGGLSAAALAAVVLVSAGCEAQLSPRAKELLALGTASYVAGENRLAVERMDAFLGLAGGSRRADEAFYIRGLAKYNLRDFAGAKSDFREALVRTDDRQVRARASLAAGDLAYDTDDMTLAEEMYRQAMENLAEGGRLTDHGHYRLGGVLQRQGRWREADVQFSRVIYFFSGSELARRSGQRLHCNAWTVQAAACEDYSTATTAARRLSEAKLPARVEPYMPGRTLQFAVRVGRYATYEQASAVLPEVRAFHADAFVVATE